MVCMESCSSAGAGDTTSAPVEGVPGIPHLLNTDWWMAPSSWMNGTYIQGAPCRTWLTQISSNSWLNGVIGQLLLSSLQDLGYCNELQFKPEWCPWKATVQWVLGIPHLLNMDGQMAGNSLIDATYIHGATCEIWVTEISLDSCQNGVHGKPLLNGQMAGNNLINGTYIPGAVCKVSVTQIRSESCQNGVHGKPLLNGQKAGNSLINGTYILGAACEVWITQISSNSCQNGVHGKPLLNGWMAGNTLINGTYILGAAYGWEADNCLINAKYAKGAACEIWVTQISSNSCQNGVHGKPLLNGQKACNSLINGTYILGAACEVWVTPISSNSCQDGVHGKPMLKWCPWKATVEWVPGMPHPLHADGQMAGTSLINAKYTKHAAFTVEGVPGMLHLLNVDGWMAGNSLINAKYIQSAACEMWVTQIISNSCQHGVHGKLLFSGCWGYCIHSIWMGGWLAIG
ncbi:hypothetical protein BKA82DRAFT_4019827 [Pisolithus tinctorius]|nr:hypothetical protein BKA82DRAFT_4019827 [Pisolithus tinctorius]